MFHVFTGCDTVSSFAGRGKRLHSKYGNHSMRSYLFFLPCWWTHRYLTTIACLCCRHMLYFYTTALAQKMPSTMPGSTCLAPKTDIPPTGAPCYSTQNGRYTRVDICGDRHSSVVQLFRLQTHTVGKRVWRTAGNHFGHCCQKQWPCVLNYYNVDARKGVEDYENVSGLPLNVHHSVIAVGTANIMIATRFNC